MISNVFIFVYVSINFRDSAGTLGPSLIELAPLQYHRRTTTLDPRQHPAGKNTRSSRQMRLKVPGASPEKLLLPGERDLVFGGATSNRRERTAVLQCR